MSSMGGSRAITPSFRTGHVVAWFPAAQRAWQTDSLPLVCTIHQVQLAFAGMVEVLKALLCFHWDQRSHDHVSIFRVRTPRAASHVVTSTLHAGAPA